MHSVRSSIEHLESGIEKRGALGEDSGRQWLASCAWLADEFRGGALVDGNRYPACGWVCGHVRARRYFLPFRDHSRTSFFLSFSILFYFNFFIPI